MNDVIKHKIKHNAHRALVSVKCVIFAILVGGNVGLCGTAFYFGSGDWSPYCVDRIRGFYICSLSGD